MSIPRVRRYPMRPKDDDLYLEPQLRDPMRYKLVNDIVRPLSNYVRLKPGTILTAAWFEPRPPASSYTPKGPQ